MKFKCKKDNLENGISIVQKATSNKTTLPLLEGILVEAYDKLRLTGNDLEIGIEYYLDADIIDKGSIVINSKMFGEIVRRLPDSEVTIEVKENNLVIIDCEQSHFEIKGMPSEGFPSLPEIEKQNSFKISQKTIRDMIKQTIFCVCLDDFRPILTGSLIEFDKGELTIVSLDGNRVAIRKSNLEYSENSFNVVIPAKTLNEIIKILQPVDDEIYIYSSKNQIMFENNNFKVVSKLLEGEFFKYRYLLTKDHETKAIVNTKKFLQSIERAYLITSEEKEKSYPVKFKISSDNMIITSNTPNGSVREEISIEMWGNDMEISFNPKYLIDALKAIDDEEINLYFTSNPGPLTIKPLEGENFAYIIMSLRG